MSRSIRIAAALIVSSFLLTPLAMAEESPAMAARTLAYQQKVEQQQMAYEANKKQAAKTQQTAAAPAEKAKAGDGDSDS